MSSRRALCVAGGLALGLAAGRASAQSCEHPTPFATICRYVVSTPQSLTAQAVGRVARNGARPRASLMLRIDGRVCGTGAASGTFGRGVAHAQCVIGAESSRLGPATHVAEAEFFGLRDAAPVSLDISLSHRGGLLSLPLEEKSLAPRPPRRGWLSFIPR